MNIEIEIIIFVLCFLCCGVFVIVISHKIRQRANTNKNSKVKKPDILKEENTENVDIVLEVAQKEERNDKFIVEEDKEQADSNALPVRGKLTFDRTVSTSRSVIEEDENNGIEVVNHDEEDGFNVEPDTLPKKGERSIPDAMEEGVSLKANNRNSIGRISSENHILKKQLAALQYEKKEMEMENQALKRQISDLKEPNVDPNKYETWNHKDILRWILSLEDGRFKQYEETLSHELEESKIRGSELDQVEAKDIKDWGIKQFGDKKSLLSHIQSLIKRQANEQETAYI